MAERWCPNCGTAVAPEVSLCPKCGERLTSSYSSAPDVSPTPRPSQLSEAPASFEPTPSFGPPGGTPLQAFDPRSGVDPGQVAPGFRPPAGGVYPQPPYHYPASVPVASKEKTTAGLLAILVGGLGIHFFYLGQKGWGLIFLLATVLSCGMGALITTPVSIVQGVLYLCATDEDFYHKYVVQKRLF